MLGLGNILTKGGALLSYPNKYSFNFDGSNDYLEFEDEFVFSGAFTVSFWVKHNSSGSEYVLGKASGDQDYFYVHPTSPRWRIADTIASSNTDIAVNEWHHILGVRDSSNNFTWYLNGSLGTLYNGSAYVTTGVTLSGDFDVKYLGRSVNNYGEIYLDEVAFWDTELSASSIAKIASKPVDLTKHSASNLKLWLRAGDKVLPEEDTSIARSDFYTAFDGSSEYVDCGSDSSLDDIWSNGGTLECWLNPSGSTANMGIMHKAGNGNQGWMFKTDSYSSGWHIRFSAVFAGTDYLWHKNSQLIPNEWSHWVITYTSNATEQATIYKNGEAITGVTHTDSTGTNAYASDAAQDLIIGSKENDSTKYNGKISGVKFYKTVLDPQTIKQLSKSRFLPQRQAMFSVVDFEGVNGIIDLGTTSDLQIASGSYTAWIYPIGNGVIYSRYVNPSYDVRWEVNGTAIKCAFNGSFHVDTGSSKVTLNAWNYVAITFNSSSVDTYVNGVSVDTDSGITVNTNAVANKIGYGDFGTYFDGSISMLAIYSDVKDANFIYAQYQKGITHNPSADTGLIGLWLMGDDTSKAYPTIADSSSNSNDGTMTSMASDDIVQQMVAGYDMGAYDNSTEELGGEITQNSSFETWDDADTINWWTHKDTNNNSGGGLISQVGSGETTGGSGTGSVNYYTSSPTNFSLSTPQHTLQDNTLYKLVIDISRWESGRLDLSFATTKSFTSSDLVNNQIVHYFVSGGSYYHYLTVAGADSVDFTFDSISIKPVLQSDLSDTHPFIADVTEPVLGSNLATVTTFANQSAYGQVNIISSSVADGAGLYKISYTVDSYTSGNFQYQSNSGTQPTPALGYTRGTSTGDKVDYININNAGTHFQFRAFNLGYTGSISNIQIRKVFGNVGAMTSMDTDNLTYSSVLPDQSSLIGINSAYNYIDLDGTDAYVDTNNTFATTFQDSFSLSAWFKADDGQPSALVRIINSQEQSTDHAVSIQIHTTGTMSLVYDSGNGKTATTASAVLSDGQETWHHIVGVVDNSSNQMYLYFDSQDQTLDGTNDGDLSSITMSDFATTRNIYIGARNRFGTAASFFGGDMGQVSIFNKALSGTEVSAIYNAGRHTNLLDDYSDNCVAYYAFGTLDAITGLADTDSTIYDRSGHSIHGTTVGTAAGDLKSPPNAEPNGYEKGDTNRSTTKP